MGREKTRIRSVSLWSDPKTETELMENIVYYKRELEFMDSIDFIKLKMVPSIPLGGHIRWTFLEKAVPRMNDYLRELWKEYEVETIEKEIKELKKKLAKRESQSQKNNKNE